MYQDAKQEAELNRLADETRRDVAEYQCQDQCGQRNGDGVSPSIEQPSGIVKAKLRHDEIKHQTGKRN